MYLKSLVIKGFKSFADRSAIGFEPGISVIVGPNGSGKSNISEAILWVLGEKNPRNLRVQSLEELIFSGSSARQAVGVAEVELILDNSDNTLPIEFDQVAISRRMYRSGESEYFINKSLCRRRDIIDILYDSGIGSSVSSIISQGNLTAVLESRPEDRRALIEDAAGVLKHKKRKESANRKLDRMDASLERVGDIVKVVESQLRPLERQAQRAEQHAKAVEELKELDLALAVDELRSLQTQWNQLSKRLNEIDAEAELASFRLNERESELSKRQLALEEKGLFAGDINEQRIRVLSIIQRLDAGMLLLEEKGKNMVSRLSDLRATIHNSQTRLSAAQAERNQIGQEVSSGEGRLQALYSGFNELTRESETATRARKEAEENYTKLASSLRNQETALDATKNNLDKTTDSMASLDIEEGLLKERFEQLDQEFLSTQKILAARRDKLEKLETELLRLKREIDLSKNEIDKFVRILDERKRRQNEQNEVLQATRAKLTGLEEIDRALEAASPALNWALENRNDFSGIVAPVSQSLHVLENAKLPYNLTISDIESLTERLLGADFFGLLVSNNAAAEQLASSLSKGKKLGALSILPIEGMRFIAEQSIRGERLIDLLDYPPEQHDAIAALLGDVYLVPTVLEAQKFHLRDRIGVRFITPEGAIVWPNGKLTVGFMIDDVEGVLERRRSIDKLTDEVESLVAALSDVELEVSTSEQNLETAQNLSLDLSQQQAKVQGDYDSVREEAVRLEESMSQMLSRKQEAERKLADVSRRRDTTAPMAGEYTERISKLELDIERLSSQVDDASKALLAATEEKNAVAERLSDCKIDLETSKGKENYSKSRLTQIDAQISSLENTLEISKETEASLNVIRLRIDPLYQLYQELHAGADKWAEKLHDQALLEQTDSTNLRKVISEANKAVETAREALTEINTRRTAVLVEQGKLESSVEHAMHRITDEHQTSLETALELPSPESRQASEERANRLRAKIANLGAVNQVAMEEYNALKTRRDYMTAQVDDLIEARKSLAKISAALDKKMRNQFLETFEQVNRNFQEIISILFPGGKGELILTEGEDPDQNGVEVSAQPQGKKILKLSMMSGGEKSLVALALMFAVYSIRQVPFYVLDEVEAALDDTNLLRLLDYLNHLRHNTQLILVSHQRRTMETADVLYGVTMQAAGVSKLVSQRLDQALGYASKDVTGGDDSQQSGSN